jgi:hypothetical protein
LRGLHVFRQLRLDLRCGLVQQLQTPRQQLQALRGGLSRRVAQPTPLRRWLAPAARRRHAAARRRRRVLKRAPAPDGGNVRGGRLSPRAGQPLGRLCRRALL